MKKKEEEFVCVHCPKGCVITIAVTGDVQPANLDDLKIEGQQCKRGIEYARQEVVEPKRVLTTTVRLKDLDRMLPVRSTEPIPKERLMEVMGALDKVEVKVPVYCGQMISNNILDLGIDIVATWKIP